MDILSNLFRLLTEVLVNTPVLTILLSLMFFDTLSGLCAAFKQGQLNSSIGWVGVTKKGATLCLVALANVIEPLLEGVPSGKLVAMFFCAQEGLSIIENAGRAGVISPAFLTPYLEKLGEQKVS